MFTLHRRWQQLVERFFDINMTKAGLSYFLTGGAKNVHCAICAFDKYARFSQIRSQMLYSLAMAKICLCGGEEHCNLKVSQFERLGDPDSYLYHENCSKNRSGTFRQLHVDSKVVPIYCTCNHETSALDERCHI